MYKREMLTLAENVFEFIDLPNYIDVGYLNKTLLINGSVAFFVDDVLGLLALPYTVLGQPDIYGRPQEIIARAYNGRYFRRLKAKDFVIMYDNNGKYPIYADILQMAERISMNKRTIDINIVHQRTPRIWKTTDDKKLSLERMLDEVDGLSETIMTYDSIDIDDMNVVLAPAPYVADKIDDHMDKEWAEFYRLIGIANLQENKKERLIRDEMSASQGGTIASRYSRYEPRKRALEEIKEKFDIDIKVRYYDGEPTSEEDDNYVNVSELYENTSEL
jgi:hypothetical protein